MRILVVEDEVSLSEIIKYQLENEKYSVDVSNDGQNGLDNALSGIYDLIILDIMLPHVDGITILREIKSNDINSKVIMLTAKSELDDKLVGFENGANDYLTKPFHMKELIARVNALLRIHSNKVINEMKFGDVVLDIDNSSITCLTNNDSITLSYRELMIMEMFINNQSCIISKEQLYDKIWGIENSIESNNLEAYLSFLRKKLKNIGSSVKIKSVRNLGYKLEE